MRLKNLVARKSKELLIFDAIHEITTTNWVVTSGIFCNRGVFNLYFPWIILLR